MQTVSVGDNLHDMTKPILWENKNTISLSLVHEYCLKIILQLTNQT